MVLLNVIIKATRWTSLMVQWIRICLPMQGAWVWSLVWDDSRCLGASRALASQLLSPCSLTFRPPLLSLCVTATEAEVPRACTPQQERPQNEKPVHLKAEWPPLSRTRASPCPAIKTQGNSNSKRTNLFSSQYVVATGLMISSCFPYLMLPSG